MNKPKTQSPKLPKKVERRFAEARKSLEEMEATIKPFLKERVIRAQSSSGKWCKS